MPNCKKRSIEKPNYIPLAYHTNSIENLDLLEWINYPFNAIIPRQISCCVRHDQVQGCLHYDKMPYLIYLYIIEYVVAMFEHRLVAFNCLYDFSIMFELFTLNIA